MKKLVILFCCLLFGFNVASGQWNAGFYGGGLSWAEGGYSQIVSPSSNYYLKGDEKLACEMILCLSDPNVQPGCQDAIFKYNLIKSKGKAAVQAYMHKCPMVGLNDYQDNSGDQIGDNTGSQSSDTKVDVNVTACTAGEFNKHTEFTLDKNYARTMSNIPESCKGSGNLPQYVCDGKYYSVEDWSRGYTIEMTTKSDYEQWKANGNPGSTTIEEKCSSGTGLEVCGIYYKHTPIVKECWVSSSSVSVESSSLSYGVSISIDPNDMLNLASGALDLASGGIKTLSSLISSGKSLSDDDTYGYDDGNSAGGGDSSDGDDDSTEETGDGSESTGDTETSSGSSDGSSSSSSSSSGFGGGFSGGVFGISTGSNNESSEEEEDEEEEEEEEYGNSASLDEYKEMSDLESYGDYKEIVKQVLENRVKADR